jgi:hypothetical protein
MRRLPRHKAGSAARPAGRHGLAALVNEQAISSGIVLSL